MSFTSVNYKNGSYGLVHSNVKVYLEYTSTIMDSLLRDVFFIHIVDSINTIVQLSVFISSVLKLQISFWFDDWFSVVCVLLYSSNTGILFYVVWGIYDHSSGFFTFLGKCKTEIWHRFWNKWNLVVSNYGRLPTPHVIQKLKKKSSKIFQNITLHQISLKSVSTFGL